MDTEIAKTAEWANDFCLALLVSAGYQEKLKQILAMEEKLGEDAPADLIAFLISFANPEEYH